MRHSVQFLQKIAAKSLRALRKIRCLLATALSPRPTEGAGRIIVQTPGMRICLQRHPSASIILEGDLFLRSDLGGTGPVSIKLGKDSVLHVAGEFVLGPNVSILVCDEGSLKIGGRNLSSASGVTCDCRIMVHRSMSIGADAIIAFNTFLTDCDWHEIAGEHFSDPVNIGDKVWIAQGVTVLKGTQIGDGCVIGAGAVVAGKTFPPRSLIVGNPARIVRQDVVWNRDIALDTAGQNEPSDD